RFLDVACHGDAALRKEIESLINADRKKGEALLTAIEREAQSLFSKEGVVGSRIGAYRVVDEIGRGGMGTVYLAVRDEDQYQKLVPLRSSGSAWTRRTSWIVSAESGRFWQISTIRTSRHSSTEGRPRTEDRFW